MKSFLKQWNLIDSVSIIHYHNKQFEVVVGHIQSCDPHNGQLHVMDHSGETHQINFRNLKNVQVNC